MKLKKYYFPCVIAYLALAFTMFFVPYIFNTFSGKTWTISLYTTFYCFIYDIQLHEFYWIKNDTRYILTFSVSLACFLIIALGIFLIIRKKHCMALYVAPMVLFFIAMIFNYSQYVKEYVTLSVGFYLALVFSVIGLVWVIYDAIKTLTPKIKAFRNRPRKPTKSERIAELEKEIAEIKGRNS